MNLIALPITGRNTTPLAYGSSTLMGATNLRDSLALLEAAYDAGIRHFDTAPSYGFGAAERCVGEFAARHNDVTLTTKYGIPPPRNQSFIAAARSIAKPILKAIPGIKQRLNRAVISATRSTGGNNYSVDGARLSLENSLRQLRVERIDLFLLHEATADDLTDENLLRFLEDATRSGKIGAFGVGSEAHKIPALVQSRNAYCRILQYEWDAFAPDNLYPASFLIHHRILALSQSRLRALFHADPTLCTRWSEEINADLNAPGTLPSLLLKAAILGNPAGITLFSSKDRHNIAANAAVAQNASLEIPATRLHAILRRESAKILQ